MLFLLTIITGAVFAVIGRKKGFVTVWTLLFNLLITIYLSVMLSPTIVGYIPALNTSYYHALCILAVAMFVFTSTNLLVGMYFSGVFYVPLPKIFNGLGAGILGFFLGFLASSFIFFMVGITPLADHPTVKNWTGDASFNRINSTLLSATRSVNGLSAQWDKHTCKCVIDWLTNGKTEIPKPSVTTTTKQKTPATATKPPQN